MPVGKDVEGCGRIIALMRNSFTRYGNALTLSSLYRLNHLIKFDKKRTMFKYITILFALMLNGSQLFAQWDVTSDTDEMTGEVSAYCSSKFASPTERMDFPYGDVKGWLGVGCDGNSEWAYVGFTTAPNLANTTTKDGYDLISTRIKFDDEVEQVTMTQDWSSKFIHFRNDSDIIEKFLTANTILLEMNWYGEGKTYFRFSGSGSTSAINQIRQSCN